ncbi:carbohydrate ABC transporter permease [Microbacterium sp. NPDC058342]|uniref:carbohydrate ABC transporter permease n=1 Tax=Microbacterium sp. NPDC058342 TaxID=3346454 RepID=UPI003657485B
MTVTIADSGVEAQPPGVPAPGSSTAKPRRRSRRGMGWGLLFASPYLLHLIALTAWPLLASLAFAFTSYDMVNAPRWVGVDNFVRLANDPMFWRTLGNTAYFAVLFVPLQTGLALLLAIALNQKLKGMALLRGAYFVPVISSWVVVAFVADAIFNARFGVANQLLQWLGLPRQDWLQDPNLVIPVLVSVAVWKGVGYMAVLFLAGLQSIPEEQYEAATLDGANAAQRLRHITLPWISGTTFLVLILTIIQTLQSFDQVFVMTDGGPNGASELSVLYLYRQGFEYFQMGYASAIAWVLLALIMLLTLVQFRLQKKWVHYA